MKLSDILNDYITQKNEIDKLNDVLKEKKINYMKQKIQLYNI